MTFDPDKFTEQEIQAATDWTLLTQSMIGMAPETNRDLLKQAVSNVADKCNARWPLERGGTMEVSESDLGVDMSGFSENVIVAFAGKTALFLFAGQDGPYQMAELLIEGIDDLADEIEEGR